MWPNTVYLIILLIAAWMTTIMQRMAVRRIT